MLNMSIKGQVMGFHKNIDFEKFPKQGDQLNKEVKVTFHYNTEKNLKGTIVRDDIEDPFLLLIKLEDGRYVRATECQYQPNFN